MDEIQLKKDEIDQLIQCPKNITDPPKKEMQLIDGNWRNDMKLQSVDGEHDFSVFMRKTKILRKIFQNDGIFKCS